MPIAGTHKSTFSASERYHKHQLTKPSITSIPVIVERCVSSPSTLEEPKNSLYYVPQDKTFDDFLFAVIKDFPTLPKVPLFFYVLDKVPPGTHTLKRVWEENRDQDGAVYVVYKEGAGNWGWKNGRWREV
ncbi:hypothetical protein BDD12DRAFT_880411 [Trichophaea hybrida]|nr:hypothetical protein BDD12DRAFT_880411 [Trichophaea hybrida]